MHHHFFLITSTFSGSLWILALETEHRASWCPSTCVCVSAQTCQGGEGAGRPGEGADPVLNPRCTCFQGTPAWPSTLSPSFLDFITSCYSGLGLRPKGELAGILGKQEQLLERRGTFGVGRWTRSEPPLHEGHQGWCGDLCPMHSGTIWEGRVQVEIGPPLG